MYSKQAQLSNDIGVSQRMCTTNWQANDEREICQPEIFRENLQQSLSVGVEVNLPF